MKIFDTFSGIEKEMVKKSGEVVNFYWCGPTVYDVPHLGHARPVIVFDLMRKFLIYKGYKVNFFYNFTDIDDKMINRAKDRQISVKALADEIIPCYLKAYDLLGVMRADKNPLATEYVDRMIMMVENLIKNGFAYELDDGIYFDVAKFKSYGKLSKQKLENLQSGRRNRLKDQKRNEQDFVLWKFAKPGEPVWKAKFGDGRPGWHIECSAMTYELIGMGIDIHAGGQDLIFPHHECEIAQSEACFGGKMAEFWVHNGFVNVGGEKMSKSLNNFKTLQELFEMFHPMVLRFFMVQTHYRSPIEFTDEALKQARNGLVRLHDFYFRVLEFDGGKGDGGEVEDLISGLVLEFDRAMSEDFETGAAITAYFGFLKEVNKLMDLGKLSLVGKMAVLGVIEKLDAVLGVLVPQGLPEISEEVKLLIEKRNLARSKRDFAFADKLREEILEKGVILEDTARGTRYRLKF